MSLTITPREPRGVAGAQSTPSRADGFAVPSPIEGSIRSGDGSRFFLRLFWMLLAYPMLASLLVLMSTVDAGLLSFASIGFWLTVGLVVLARYVDVVKYNGNTSEGDRPATLHDVKRFSAVLTSVAGASWVLAQVL